MGGGGSHTPSHSLALSCVQQTSRPTVSGGRQRADRRLAPPPLGVFTLTLAAHASVPSAEGARRVGVASPCLPVRAHYTA